MRSSATGIRFDASRLGESERFQRVSMAYVRILAMDPEAATPWLGQEGVHCES